MSATDAKYHRTQRTNDACHATACTIAASLTCIAAYTRGEHGPSTSLDTFRSYQLDKVGGQDLYDCKYAARRLGVSFSVWADYGPGVEYSEPVREGLRDEPATSPSYVVGELKRNRFVVMQLDYGALDMGLRHDASFRGGHSVALLGHRVLGGQSQVLVSDPLATSAHWHAALPFWAAAAALAGPGKCFVSMTGIRPSNYVARVKPLSWWHRHTHSGGTWHRERRWTVTGWHAACEPPQAHSVDGVLVILARVTQGGYAGSYVAPAGYSVSVSEVQ